VPGRIRKIKRQRLAGEIAIEQTRDYAQVAALIEAAGMTVEDCARPAVCYLVAYYGNDPAGAVGIETVVDVALIQFLVVTAPLRRCGIGSALFAAARKAAHTRGARRLFALSSDDGYLRRLGFVPVELHEVIEAFGAALSAGATRPNGAAAGCVATCLDIARDGIIMR